MTLTRQITDLERPDDLLNACRLGDKRTMEEPVHFHFFLLPVSQGQVFERRLSAQKLAPAK